MDHSIIKSLLRKDFYEQNQTRLKASLFEDEVRDLYNVITEAHDRYDHDLCSNELNLLYEQQHPVATRSEKEVISDLIERISQSSDISNEVASDILLDLYRKTEGLKIANYGISISEGRFEALEEVKNLISKIDEDFEPDDLPQPCRLTIDELMATASDANRWQFNIPTLSRHVYGIGPGEFMVVFALSNVGKSAFGISLCFAPGGFVSQGAKCMIVGNEEVVARTRLRAVIAYSGVSARQIAEGSGVEGQTKFSEIEDQVEFIDAQGLDLNTIEACIKRFEPDVVIVDVADKIVIPGNFNAGHERLRALYVRLRETAKTYNCMLLGVSQASAEAHNRTILPFTMMENSKIGKASEADLICGIGAYDDPDDNTRYLSISKNKLNGWHGTEAVQLQTEVNRYVA